MKFCVLCGHEMMVEACGFASVWLDEVEQPLCHADDHDCYGLWTLYGRRPNGADVQPAIFYPDPEPLSDQP